MTPFESIHDQVRRVRAAVALYADDVRSEAETRVGSTEDDAVLADPAYDAVLGLVAQLRAAEAEAARIERRWGQ